MGNTGTTASDVLDTIHDEQYTTQELINITSPRLFSQGGGAYAHFTMMPDSYENRPVGKLAFEGMTVYDGNSLRLNADDVRKLHEFLSEIVDELDELEL